MFWLPWLLLVVDPMGGHKWSVSPPLFKVYINAFWIICEGAVGEFLELALILG